MKKILFIVLLLASSLVLAAKDYKFIAPVPPGGGIGDVISRKLAQMYSDRYGCNCSVLNIPGGNHIPSIVQFKKEPVAAILLTTTSAVINYVQQDNLPYSLNDFNVIASPGNTVNLYYTTANSEIKTVDDLKRLDKTKFPFIVGSSQATTLNVNALSQELGLDIQTILYKGYNEAAIDVIGGRALVGLTVVTVASTTELEKEGRIRFIGSTDHKPFTVNGRTVPSVGSRFGIPQWNNTVWVAVTPGDGPEQKKFAKNIKTLMNSQEFKQEMTRVQVSPNRPAGLTPVEEIEHARALLLKNKQYLEAK